MELVPTRNFDLIKHVVMGLRDMAFKDVTLDWKPEDEPNCVWLAVVENSSVLGYFKLEEETSITVVVHVYMRRDVHGTDIPDRASIALHNFLKQTGYHIALSKIPSCCAHTLKHAIDYGFKEVGRIPNGVQWHGDIHDYII